MVGLYFIHVTFSQLASDDVVSLTFLGTVSSRRFSGYHIKFLVSTLIIINNLEQGKLNVTVTTRRMNYRIVDLTTQ